MISGSLSPTVSACFQATAALWSSAASNLINSWFLCFGVAGHTAGCNQATSQCKGHAVFGDQEALSGDVFGDPINQPSNQPPKVSWLSEFCPIRCLGPALRNVAEQELQVAPGRALLGWTNLRINDEPFDPQILQSIALLFHDCYMYNRAELTCSAALALFNGRKFVNESGCAKTCRTTGRDPHGLYATYGHPSR